MIKRFRWWLTKIVCPYDAVVWNVDINGRLSIRANSHVLLANATVRAFIDEGAVVGADLVVERGSIVEGGH